MRRPPDARSRTPEVVRPATASASSTTPGRSPATGCSAPPMPPVSRQPPDVRRPAAPPPSRRPRLTTEDDDSTQAFDLSGSARAGHRDGRPHRARIRRAPSGADGAEGSDTSDGPPPGDGPPAERRRGPWWRRRAVLVPAGAVAVLAAAYGADLLISSGDIPRSTVVAGVDIGGLSPAAAATALESDLAPRVVADHTVVADDVEATLSPATAGIMLDVDATVDEADDQPLNPWTRLVTLFSDREVDPVITGEDTALSAQIETIAAQVDRAPVDATIAIEGTTPERRRGGGRPHPGPRRLGRRDHRGPGLRRRPRRPRSSCRWTSSRWTSTTPRRSACWRRRSTPALSAPVSVVVQGSDRHGRGVGGGDRGLAHLHPAGGRRPHRRHRPRRPADGAGRRAGGVRQRRRGRPLRGVRRGGHRRALGGRHRRRPGDAGRAAAARAHRGRAAHGDRPAGAGAGRLHHRGGPGAGHQGGDRQLHDQHRQRGQRREHPRGGRRGRRCARAARRDLQPERLHRPARRWPRATSRPASSTTASSPPRSAAASASSRPRCSTRSSSPASRTSSTSRTATTSAATRPAARRRSTTTRST